MLVACGHFARRTMKDPQMRGGMPRTSINKAREDDATVLARAAQNNVRQVAQDADLNRAHPDRTMDPDLAAVENRPVG
jgi:hypothetical protein